MKLNYNNKRQKKAFTLIELLIVIAIIGILFVVLISRVDFATDKAKATGVQTDFRAFQMAFEQVSKENAGFATFGWDTGDVNGNRIRDSYDQGDTDQDGVEDPNEIWTGRKTYGETWTNVYTLKNPKPGMENDYFAVSALEAAINANLDPKLHITIANPDANGRYFITMANQARDPWGKEYHGEYLTNATVDNMDRGAIILYSDGANGKNGSEHSIANGVVTVIVPGNNVDGQDDYVLVNCYTYINGYGETTTQTHGFSNNQILNQKPITNIPNADPDNNGGGNTNGGGVSSGGVSNPTPSLPDKNEYGFYFNQPYQATINGALYEYVFYPDGSASLWMSYEDEHGGMYIPAGEAIYTENTITISGDPATVSDDGKTLTASGLVMILKPTTNQKIKYNVLYENASEGAGIMFKSDGSVSLYEGDTLFATLPAGSAVLHDYYVDLTIDGETMPCPVYPNGSKMMFNEFVFVCGCTHERTTIKNIAATCGTAGMNNAEVCVDCEAIIKEGSAVPATGIHQNITIINYQQPTCIQVGYSGDQKCNDCNQVLHTGTSLPIVDVHTSTTMENVKEAICGEVGYTGDEICTTCGKVVALGEVIEAPGQHIFNSAHECENCNAWQIPAGGMYYVGVASNKAGDYTGATQIYEPGDILTEIKNGDTYVYGNYEYRYGSQSSYNGYYAIWNTYFGDGWGVRCINDVASPGPILDSVNRYPILSISSAFEWCKNVETVEYIPESVVNVRQAFHYCSALKYVSSLPSGIRSLERTFENCQSLLAVPSIPEGVTNLFYAFEGCTSITAAPAIPSSVTDMDHAFRNCVSLVTPPDMSNAIGVNRMQCTFETCRSLISIPDLSNCTKLTSLDSTFRDCSSLVDLSNCIIPNHITKMSNTFSGCTSMIIAPQISINIGSMSSTFEDCTSLIELPDLSECTKLLGMHHTFAGCTSITDLSSYVIPSGVTRMCAVFQGCISLVKAPVLPDSVYDLWCAFEGCTSLVTAPAISSNVTNMYSTFSNCHALAGTVTINANPGTYGYCFRNIDFANQNLILVGTSTQLDAFGATGINYCSTCKGTCQNNH